MTQLRNNPIAGLRHAAGALLVLAIIILGAPWTTSPVALAQDQVLFVSVTDGAGEPVTDLEPDDIGVQWDGAESEIRELEPIDWPVRLTVFVDNGEAGRNSIPLVRDGLRAFLQEIPDDVEVAFLTLARQPRWITRHTADREELTKAIDLIVPDAGASARYLDALIEEAGRIDDDDEREYFPVIVMIATDGAEGSTGQQRAFQQMGDRLVQNSATVHTRLLRTSSGTGAGGRATQVGTTIGEGTRGSFETLGAGSAWVTLLPQLGADIARKHKLVSNQYRVTYRPPDGASQQPSISVGTTRSGLQVFPTTDGNVP